MIHHTHLTEWQLSAVREKWPEDDPSRFLYEFSVEGEPLRREPDPDAATAIREMAAPGDQVRMIPLYLIDPSPTNPRKHFDREAHDDLTASMRHRGFMMNFPLTVREVEPRPEAQPVHPANEDGPWEIVHPITRKPLTDHLSREVAERNAAISRRYELIFGERRWRAAKSAGLQMAPCFVRSMEEVDVLELQLLENVREPLNPIDEACHLRQLLDLKRGDGRPVHTVKTLAERVGRSEAHVARIVLLSGLTGEFRDAVAKGIVPPKTAYEVAKIPDEVSRFRAASEVLRPQVGEGPMSLRETTEFIRRELSRDLRRAAFDPKDETLKPGACTECLHNSAANAEKTAGGRLHGLCSNIGCYRAKEGQVWVRWQEVNDQPEKGRVALHRGRCEELFDEQGNLDWRCEFIELKAKPDGGLLRADAFPAGQEAPTWREMTESRIAKVYLARDPQGRTRELVELETAKAAAELNGFNVFKTSRVERPRSEEQAREAALEEAEERDERGEAQKEFQGRVMRDLELKATTLGYAPPGFMLLMGLWVIGIEGMPVAAVLERRGIKTTAALWLASASEPDRLSFVAELFVAECIAQGAIELGHDMLELFGVDFETMRKEAGL